MQPDSTDPPAPFPCERVPPELLAWAQQTFDAEEFLEDVREIEATGGHSFDSFIAEVEAKVRGQ
jgi:hypothetical protein